MSRQRSPINLFGYLDYRAFLRDWYAAMKQQQRAFSFRAFSQRAGFRSPNFLKLVMDGDRNLTATSVESFMVGLRLNKQEQAFFRELVLFTQASDHEVRDRHYQRLLQCRKFQELKPVDREQYAYYGTWYHPVLRELIASPNFDGTARWLAEHCRPQITEVQAERALQVLAQLRLIERDAQGRWRQTQSLVTTGPEVRSLVLMNYHRELLELTKQQLAAIPAAQRDVSALTLGITRARIPELKRKIQEFRREILQWVSTETAPEVVLQLNMQCLPVTPWDEV